MTDGSINKVLYNVDQRANTTEAEKKTARDNIGAVGLSDIEPVMDERYKLLQQPINATFASFAVIDRYSQTSNGLVDIHCSYIYPATESTNGLMSAGDKTKLDNIPYNAEANVQSDWDETDPTSDAFIKNKPSVTLQVQSDWDESDNTLPSYIQNKPTIPSGDQLVPSASSSDEGKVLVVDENGHPTWEYDATGITAVAHDTTLTGDGTSASPLSVNSNTIQEKLTPGTGITITNNVISADTQVQSDWSQSDNTAVDYIKNKPDLSVYATKSELTSGLADKQDTLTAGSNITISNNVISATAAPQQQADWAQSDSTAVDYIKNKPQNLVQDANYVHTDNNFTTAEKTKLDGIAAGAEVNVQANWNESDSSSDAYIQNKPQNLVQDANYVHTDNNFTTSEKTKLSGIQAGAEQNVQSDWAQSDSSADDFIKNKPVIPIFPTMKELVAGTGITIVDDDYEVTISSEMSAADKAKLDGIEAGAEVNVQADWTQTDSTTDDYIKNKPANLVQDANYVHTDNNFSNSYKNKLNDIAAGAEVNVQSDWNQTNSSSDAFIKNKPTVPDIVSTTTSIPPVDTDITTLRIFTDGRVQGNSSTIGCIAPEPSQLESGKILQATWSGSPSIGRAIWVDKPIGVPASVVADEGKVLTVDNTGTAAWQKRPQYFAGEGLTETTDLDTGDITFDWAYTVGRNLHINQNNAIQTNLPGGTFDAPANQSNDFTRLTGADFAGAYRLACRHNTSDNYELAIAYTASGMTSSYSFIGTETIVALDNSVTTKQAVYLGETCVYTPTTKFGGVTSTAFDPTRHKAIIYDGIGQIGPTTDCKIAIYSDANSNVKIAFTAIEVGKVGSTT